MRFNRYFFTLLFWSYICFYNFVVLSSISFEESMRSQFYQQEIDITERVIGINGRRMFSFYKELYEKNSPDILAKKYEEEYEIPTLKIPKIIHQIWIGSPVPEAFVQYMNTWKEMHPEWEYRLWTDDNVHEITLYNQHFFEQTDSPGVKSDLLKWEIIYRFGGVYVDVDFECLRSLEPLHYVYNFYTGLQPLDTQFLQLGAALFAACPGHPILKDCIETIKDDWHHKGAPTKTGPVHFTKSFYRVAGKTIELTDIAFPASYFYPLGCRQTGYAYEEWITQGAYAIHHWAKSWMPTHYRPKQFRALGNEALTVGWNE